METRLIDTAISELASTSGIPVAFGGAAVDGVVAVTAIAGARTNALDGLSVSPRLGLGGQALIDARPHSTGDYGSSRRITHDYDRHILGEGIAALLAVPIVVAGRTRGMLYGGSRAPGTVGDRFAASALAVAARLARQFAEHDARTRATDHGIEPPPAAVPTASLEDVRVAYAELRSITGTISDEALRARLATVERRLAALGGVTVTGPAATRPSASTSPAVALSRREHDVLGLAAVGLTNADIANRLGLRESTVKSYLASAMTKLDASTRLQAVSEARRHGLIP
ncbi:LuxR C-terminal-related transcriptional regulator [Labedella populi]|nr:LuxR C-terminal-related transcriptional regulator [Labedella populi]